MPSLINMSEVQALLSVDAGRVPPGTMAFFVRVPEATGRKLCAMLAVAIDMIALAGALAGLGRAPIALLALAGVLLALRAVPTKADDAPQPAKRPTLVITSAGMIVRDNWGLRTWRFDELSEVRAFVHQQHVGMLIVKRDGARDFVDTLLFERGERVREFVGRRLDSRQAIS